MKATGAIDYRTGEVQHPFAKYSEDQERDENGRFGSGSGGGGSKDSATGGHGSGAQHVPDSHTGSSPSGKGATINEHGTSVQGSGKDGKYAAGDVKPGDKVTMTHYSGNDASGGKQYETREHTVTEVRTGTSGTQTTVHVASSDGVHTNAVNINTLKPGSVRR